MERMTRVKNVLVVMVFCIVLAGNVASMEKDEYRFASIENEIENIASEMQEQVEQIECQYPIVLESSIDGSIYFAALSDDIFLICGEDKYGYIKVSGDEITDYEYEVAYPFSEGLACVRLNGKYGFIDENGEVAISFAYDDATPFSEGLAYFVKDGSYGFLRLDGSVAFYLDCDSVSSFREGLAYFTKDGKYGYMDKNGRTVIEPTYHDAEYFENGVAIVTYAGYKGIVDKMGNVIVPLEYDEVIIADNYIKASTSDEKFFFDFEGKRLSAFESATRGDVAGSDKRTEFKIEGNTIIVVQYKENTSNESKLILKNSITPKNEMYWKLLYGEGADIENMDGDVVHGTKFNDFYVTNYIKTAKLYIVDNFEKPILYCCEAAVDVDEYDSDVYYMQDDTLKWLLTADRSNGTIRGDYVCLWRDNVTGDVLLGTSGAAGGFGGYAGYSHVYTYEDGCMREVFSDEVVSQVLGNYNDEDLEKEPHLFYNDANEPYNSKTIWEAEIATEYLVNDDRVTYEEYQAANQRYTFIRLPKG